MMAAVIVLAVALAGSSVAIITLAVYWRSAVTRGDAAVDRERAQGLAQLEQERAMSEAQLERDVAITKAKGAQDAADKAIGALSATQLKLNIATSHLMDKVSAEVLTKDVPQLADVVRDLLTQPLGGR
jgi:hypothetical protein